MRLKTEWHSHRPLPRSLSLKQVGWKCIELFSFKPLKLIFEKVLRWMNTVYKQAAYVVTRKRVVWLQLDFIMWCAFLGQVQEAIDSRDGQFCAELVSFKHPHVANPRLQVRTCYTARSSFWHSFCSAFSFPSSLYAFLPTGDKPQESVLQPKAGSPCRLVPLSFYEHILCFHFYSGWFYVFHLEFSGFLFGIFGISFLNRVLKVCNGQVYIS